MFHKWNENFMSFGERPIMNYWLMNFVFFVSFVGIPVPNTTRSYCSCVKTIRVHTECTYLSIASMRSSILQRAQGVQSKTSKWKWITATVQFHRTRCVSKANQNCANDDRLHCIVVHCCSWRFFFLPFTELAIQPSLNPSLMPRTQQSSDSGNAAASSTSNAGAASSSAGSSVPSQSTVSSGKCVISVFLVLSLSWWSKSIQK